MFDFVNRKKRVVQVIMGLAVLPFLFWGVESYRQDGGESVIADVEGEKIHRREFDQALRDHQDRMRSMLGANIDVAILDNPELKSSVLDRLIQQRLLRLESINMGMTVLDSQLVRAISDIPDFQQEGQFSNQRYEEVLSRSQMNPLMFESRMRDEIMLQQLLDAYTDNGFVSNTVAKKVMYLSEVERDVNLAEIQPDQFLSQINPSEKEITDYFESHQVDFHLPERARVEYVVLTLDSLAEKQVVNDDEISEYFEEYKHNFEQAEERQASHILLSITDTATIEEKAAINEKAMNLLEQIKQTPERFAEFAAEHSDDPGSATQGGDLGFFGRGVMVKTFEDEIFQMQLDEIRGPVETDFGLHIIKLTGIKEAKIADLSEVKQQIKQDLQKYKAGAIFGEIAEDFSNTVYEQSDTLQYAAEEFELTLHQSDWIDIRSTKPEILANERLLNAVFSDDTVKDKRNTDAIEVKQDTLVSARILDHRIASTQSLTLVKDEIFERLKGLQAAEMAIKDGENKLAQLQSGADDLVAWGESKQISYLQPQDLDTPILQAVFKAPLTKLPAYVGIANPQGSYSLVRINRSIEPEVNMADDAAKHKSLSQQLQQMINQEEMSSYFAELRKRYDVTIMQQSIDY